MAVEEMKQATLLNGPFDGLELDVKADEIEVHRLMENKRNVAVYRTYDKQGKTFRFIEYQPAPGSESERA